MRKGLVVFVVAVLVAAFALPASAEMTMSGFVRVKARLEQNYVAPGHGDNNVLSSGSFILPRKDAPTAGYVEQRQRFKFDWKGENVGAVGFFEMDFGAWGDSQYAVGRNQGAGLEADSINLETKNFYIYFNVPNTSLQFQVGLQNQSDSFAGVVFGVADMAGIFFTGKFEPINYRLAWAKFTEGGTAVDDDVDLYLAEVKFAPTKDVKLGVDLYAIRDAAGSNQALGPLATTIGRLGNDYGLRVTQFHYDPSIFYYAGVDASLKAGPATISGFGFYNWGTIENLLGNGTLFGGPTAVGDVDVKAWVLDLRADFDLGPGKAFVEGIYVSGTGENSNDFEAPITASNYALAGSWYARMDMQILFPNNDDINASTALAYDVQNKGRGVMAIAGGYSHKLSNALSAKVGAGFMKDAEDTLGTGNKHSAIEVNANANYALLKGLDLGLYAAWATLSDWESYRFTSDNITNTAIQGGVLTSEEADDIWKVYARLNYAF